MISDEKCKQIFRRQAQLYRKLNKLPIHSPEWIEQATKIKTFNDKHFPTKS